MPTPDDSCGHAVVAVDGPSGAGKSSVSRGVATALGLRYLDTGSTYRALTWWLLARGVDVQDAARVAEHAAIPAIVAGTDPAHPTITVDGVDVAGPIRSAEVTAAVSAVSAVPAVRRRLVGLQQAVVAAARAGGSGIVVEGRDIGTVVLPQADLKVYLVADAAVRARRRAAQEGRAADAASADTLDALARRDALDSRRATSPLRAADDAVVVDASAATLEQVIGTVVSLVRAAVQPTPAEVS